ncbi:MAG: ribose-phosphate diphosphokinase [Treponema sp.]
MNFIAPNNLAIVSCPGGKFFADLVVKHLDSIYKKRFLSHIEVLSEKYSVSKEQLINDFNRYSDMSCFKTFKDENEKIEYLKDKDSIRLPKFDVDVDATYFANGEVKVEINGSIRGKHVFIFQDVENRNECVLNKGNKKKQLTLNDHLMFLLVTIDAVKHAGCKEITLVLPVYPYSRQHKKKGREGLTASLLGHFYEQLGVKDIITLDIHSREIENTFSSTKLENLHASYQIIKELGNIVDITNDKKDPFIVVSPDSGAVDRNKFYSAELEKQLAMLYKERDYSKVSENVEKSNIASIKLLGDVAGKNVFLADDMLATGGTLIKAMEFLKENKAKRVIAAISLPLFNEDAIDQFEKAYRAGLFYRIIGTNAVRHTDLKGREWYIEADVSAFFAEVIIRIYNNESISDLLDNRHMIKGITKGNT